jgi:hypothetical protein
MSQPTGQPGPVEAMLASDAATRMLGIEVLAHGEALVAEARSGARYGRALAARAKVCGALLEIERKRGVRHTSCQPGSGQVTAPPARSQ